jgi:hypothetical protein
MEKNGRSGAATKTIEEIEELSPEQRQRLIDAIERIGECNRDADPDQVLSDVTAAVEQVRQERYEEEQRAKAEGRR